MKLMEMHDVSRRACLLLWFFALVSAGCGGSQPEHASAPAEEFVDEIEAPTSAVDVLLTEKLPNGKTNWTLQARGIVDKNEYMEADSVLLRVHEQDTPTAAPAGGISIYMAGGCTVIAERGTVLRGAGTLSVELLGGFIMISTNGWQARGERLKWDGVLMSTEDPVTVLHGQSIVKGSGARIDPRRNRVFMDDVSGLVENLAL